MIEKQNLAGFQENEVQENFAKNTVYAQSCPTCFGHEGEERTFIIFRDKPMNNFIGRPRRELNFDMVTDRNIFKNNHIMLFHSFTFRPIPKARELHKTVIFLKEIFFLLCMQHSC